MYYEITHHTVEDKINIDDQVKEILMKDPTTSGNWPGCFAIVFWSEPLW